LKYSKFLLLSIFTVLIIIIPLFYQDAYGAIPTVSDTQANNAEASTTCAITVAVGASDTMIVVGANSDAGSLTVADEDGQTYVSRVAESASHWSTIWTTTSPATNVANTITVTHSSGDVTCFALVLAGTDEGGTPIGITGSNSGISGTTDTVTYSTANNNSLVVETCGSEWSNVNTHDASKTVTTSTNGGANKFGGSIAQEGQATAGSNDFTCIWGRAVDWSHAQIEIKEAPSPPSYNIDNIDVYESGS
jgi:hypothetical protein